MAHPAEGKSAQLQKLSDEIKSGDLAAAMKTYDALPQKVQSRPRAQVLLAAVLLKSGQTERARQALRAADSLGNLGTVAQIERAPLLKRLGELDAFHDALLQIHAARPRNRNNLLALFSSFLRRGETLEAERALADMETLGAEPGIVHRMRYELALARLDVTAMIGILDEIVATEETLPKLPQLMITLREFPEPQKSRIQGALQAKWPEMTEKLVRWMNRSVDAKPTGESTGDIWHGAPANIPSQADFCRALVADDGTEVIESPVGTSGTTLLVFSGLADRAMAPVEWIDAFCAAGNHSAIYLRDFKRSLYIDGISALAPDYEQTLTALQGILAKHGTRRLLCLGTSAGGFGAIRYGLRLGAERILAASPPASLNAMAEMGDVRGQLFVKRMQAQFGKGELDLTPDVV